MKWLSRSRVGEVLLLLSLLFVAAPLRSAVGYRTASVDEAIHLVNGWRWLSGQAPADTARLPGWHPLSLGYLGWAGYWGGVELARGLNALWGVLTVALVYRIGKQAYGTLAGYLAGLWMAVSGPAIAIQTLATSSAGSVLLFAGAVWLWVTGLREDRGERLAWGSTVAVASVLMRFSAYHTVMACIAVGVLAGAAASVQVGGLRPGYLWIHLHRPSMRRTALFALPFAFLPLFLLASGSATGLAHYLRLGREGIAAENLPALLSDVVHYLWLPVLCGLLAFLAGADRRLSLALAVVGLGALPYHLLTRDATTLPQSVAYMMVGLAPLAGGGLLRAIQSLQRLRPGRAVPMALLVATALALLYFGRAGQQDLASLRSYWSDVSPAMALLQANLKEGDTVLMEGGQVGEYYLIEKGSPGRIPSRVWTTWYYQDEGGSGADAYERGIRDKRFDWIVFDYSYTAELNQRLYGTMAGRYELEATFPARLHGRSGRVEVFRALP